MRGVQRDPCEGYARDPLHDRKYNLPHRATNQHLWSNPDAEWEGFEPVTYWLASKSLELPLTRKLGDGKTESTTIGTIYGSVNHKQIAPESLAGGLSVETEVTTVDGSKLILLGPDFNRRILDVMLKLSSEGIDPFATVWYYYDKDLCLEDAQRSYTFFVVHNGKIVRQQVSFFDSHDSGFDPSLFASADRSNPIWSNEEAWAEANAKYWYRQFYSETRTGQLMALRSDEPTLFFSDEHPKADNIGALLFVAHVLRTIRILLWALVALAVANLIVHLK